MLTADGRCPLAESVVQGDTAQGALLVFDDEEPVGLITDHFPGTPAG